MEAKTIFFIFWGIAVTYILISLYVRGKKALSIFPDISSVKIIYRDKTGSGYSTESWLTKAGGAQNALDIVVTEQELWLKSMILFAGVGKQNDLIHRIPFDNIIEKKKEGKKVTVDFKTELGEHMQVVLETKKPEELLRALN